MIKTHYLVFIPLIFCACNGEEEKKAADQNEVRLVFSPAPQESHQMVYEMLVQNDSTGDRTQFVIDFTSKVKSSGNEKIILLTHYNAISMTGQIHGKHVQLNAADHVKDQMDASLVASPVFAYLGKDFETIYDQRFNKIEEEQVRLPGDSSVVAAESKIQFIGRYPDRGIKKGDSWKNETSLKIGSNEIKSLQYTVSTISEKEVKIALAGEINTSGEKFGQEFTIMGNLKGNITVDRKTGWQTDGTINTRFILDMSGKKTPMQQTISFRLK